MTQLVQPLPRHDLLAWSQLLRRIILSRFYLLELEWRLGDGPGVLVRWWWLQFQQLPLFDNEDLVCSGGCNSCPHLLLLITKLSHVLSGPKLRLLQRRWRQRLHDLVYLIDSIHLLVLPNNDPVRWRLPLHFLISRLQRRDSIPLETACSDLLDQHALLTLLARRHPTLYLRHDLLCFILHLFWLLLFLFHSPIIALLSLIVLRALNNTRFQWHFSQLRVATLAELLRLLMLYREGGSALEFGLHLTLLRCPFLILNYILEIMIKKLITLLIVSLFLFLNLHTGLVKFCLLLQLIELPFHTLDFVLVHF